MESGGKYPAANWQDLLLPFDQEPELLRELGNGRTNRNYLLKADNRYWVLRINAPNSRELGIDRERERTVLEHASAAGLSPRVFYCSVDSGVLVTEFIEGRHWQAADLEAPEKQTLLQETLARIHALKVPVSGFNYREHAEHYWQWLLDSDIAIPETLYHQRENVLPFIDDIPASKTLCHHDPGPQNVIEDAGRLYFLDWEYASPGWAAFDLAALSVEWNLDSARLSLPAGIDTEEIIMARKLYSYLCALWNCVQSQNQRS